MKSLSKGLALSGMRAAYLVAHPDRIRELALWTPPWWVSLPAQMMAVAALAEPAYYRARYAETSELRDTLVRAASPWFNQIFAGSANWILAKVPSATQITAAMAEQGVFVRNAGLTAPSLGDEWIRIAVKTRSANDRIVAALSVATARCKIEPCV